jgi:hypothetical protein|uniref:Uncharacterized protein n=1 Tax=Chlorobium chlorochromatii (strain CaD3) TaxID=340177 RepID=Q3ATD4_CHLCH
MSWLVLLAMALTLFFSFVVLFRKFLGYMKKEQNLVIEPLKDALIDKDNPVGLNPEELQKLKQQQQEAQRHLSEVIAKIPVIQKDGRFQIDQEAIQKRKEELLKTENISKN